MSKSITHTQASLELTYFADRNPGWHGYKGDLKTLNAVNRAEYLLAIEVNRETRQFRSNKNRREKRKITPCELASILAGLRLLQQTEASFLMAHFDTCNPLTTEEIDTLCETLNCGGLSL